MTKLELLNVFLNDRLTAAADDIFRAVRDTVAEYQSEILRSKEENERLRRLLNVAVQRLLLPSEPPSVHLTEDSQLCESEWRSSLEPAQVKEEPHLRATQPEGVQVAGHAEEGGCSHVEQQRLHPEPARSGSSPPPASMEIKTENEQPAVSLPPAVEVRSERRAAQSDSCASAKSLRPQKTTLLRSNGKPNIMPMKSVRPLKLPLSRSSHQTQSMQRWHSCKECGKGFSFACQLEVHMRWHTKEKPYSCAVCRKSFTTVSMLKRHHRIHTGEKPFRCHVCGKCFNQSAHLNTHFRLHTRDRAAWGRTSQCK